MADRQRTILLILLFLIPFAVYSGNLAGGFVYDDNVQLLENEWVTDVRFIPDILTSGSMFFFDEHMANTYRPTIYLVYMAVHYVFGFNPLGYHLVNNILHSINALLVFLVAARLMAGAGVRVAGGSSGAGAGLLGPFFAGLIFALHPINSEVVSWVGAIPELVFTLLVLLAFYLYVKAGDRGGVFKNPLYFALSIICFFLALLSKETAMALIVMIPVYEFSTGGLSALTGGGRRKLWGGWLVYVAAALVYMAIRTSVVGGVMHVKMSDVTLYESLLNIFPLVARYLGKLLMPVGLSVIYTYPPVRSVFEPMAIMGIIGSLLFIGLIVLARRAKLIFFGLIWIFIPLIPVLYLPAISVGGFADRYLYLPSVGFAMAAVIFVEGVSLRYRGASSGAGLRGPVVIFLSAVLVLYAAGSVKRSMVWRDDRSLWTDAVRKSPDSDRAHYNIAWKLQKMGRDEGAIKEYKEAIRLNPDKIEAHRNIVILYRSTGDWPSAIRHLLEVIRIAPFDATAYYDMAMAYQSMGSSAEPVELYKEAIRLESGYVDAHYNLGWTYQLLGDYENAVFEYATVIRLDPQSADAYYNLGLIYAELGKPGKAAVHFRGALNVDPGYLKAREKLRGLAASEDGDGDRR